MGAIIGSVQGAEISVEKDPHFCMWYVGLKFEGRLWRRSLSKYFSHVNPAFRGTPVIFRELEEAKASAEKALRDLRADFRLGPEWIEDRYRGREIKRVQYDPRPFRLGGYV